ASWDEPLTLMEMSDDVRAVAQAVHSQLSKYSISRII
ncbi:hypothetical protein Q604_UNBC17213G0001, partial [human gut metagenome]